MQSQGIHWFVSVARVKQHLNPDALWDLAAGETKPARRALSWKM
jgi:hypothetical protein